ncbi:TOBE domain-containing protein [Robertkochia flava]|uniref:TOBE domain-containing protein n=1 Tax=Robertkochia flava TaxID=3447986 RepID=UPI001CCF1684|nr:TOBE domain-containing protein [Robertkochia marina]
MNRLSGHILDIETAGDLSIVTIAVSPSIQIRAIVIETPGTATYLEQGHPVDAVFKETEVILSTDPNPAISISNKIPCVIKSIESGRLMTRVELQCAEAVITGILPSAALEELRLEEGQSVLSLVKFNEIMLTAK